MLRTAAVFLFYVSLTGDSKTGCSPVANIYSNCECSFSTSSNLFQPQAFQDCPLRTILQNTCIFNQCACPTADV
ncbi:hypothetical protein FKM82_018766 [Ascaphus truei]